MSELTLKKTRSNVFYVIGAQFIVLTISVIRSLLLPAFFSVESYGYWQLYLFYSAYVGIFAFGFNDGIYLRYGDYNYNELPFAKLRTSIRVFFLMSVGISVIAAVLIGAFCTDKDLKFALLFSALNISVLSLTGIFTYVLQITNQIKKYSFFVVADKILVIITVVLMFFMNNDNYKTIIVIDFLGKAIVVSVMIYLCKELWIGKNSELKVALKEFKENINVGVKLLLANLMGMLIIGIGRFIIQIFGDIRDFASYSFGITITGLVLTAITAFSLVLYPAIKRLDSNNYYAYFKKINSFIIAFNFLALLLYFPAYFGVNIIYTKYNDLLPYLNLLFVITILQGKMSILNNTFYKVLRKEKQMLTANITSVILFITISPIFFYLTKSIWSIAFSTFITMMFRCYASEIYLRNLMMIKTDYKYMIEILFIVLFLVTTNFSNTITGFSIYLLFLITWISMNRGELARLVKTIRS